MFVSARLVFVAKRTSTPAPKKALTREDEVLGFLEFGALRSVENLVAREHVVMRVAVAIDVENARRRVVQSHRPTVSVEALCKKRARFE